jgi:hypothetical protein
MNKTGSKQKSSVTRVNAVSWLSSCSAPSQHMHILSLSVKIVYNYGLRQNFQLLRRRTYLQTQEHFHFTLYFIALRGV